MEEVWRGNLVSQFVRAFSKFEGWRRFGVEMQLVSLCRHVNLKDGEYWFRNLVNQLDNPAKKIATGP